MPKFKMIRILTTLTILLIFVNLPAQDDGQLKNNILTALGETCDYAMYTLLDENGASRCEYNMIDGKWYPYEVAWHTGQIIYGLVSAYNLTGNKTYLEYAQKAGDWWCSLAITGHPKLNGMIRAIHGDGIEYIVFSTISDGSAGLFDLYQATGDRKYADAPTTAGKWMLENMYEPEHRIFYDMVDQNTGEVQKEFSMFWEERKEQSLYDVARPNNEGSLFKDMYEYSGDEKYKKIFLELCESLVEKQGPEGLWMDFTPNNKEDGTIHPRFNLWYAESLIDGYELTGDKKYLEAARKTILTFQKIQRSDGTIFYHNYIDGRYRENSITGSAVAFMGILYIRMLKTGYGDEFKASLETTADWVLKNRFSAQHPDKNLAGGVINTKYRVKKGQIRFLQRDIGTAFGVRFLVDYYNYKFQ